MRRWTILSSLALLVIAIGLVLYGTTHIPEPRFTGRLADLLPPAPAGWTMKEKPIADSEELKQAVGELLNYDDGVFVDYTNTSGERLSVYIAYWTPGKMSHRLVAGHTPDVCWVNGGWEKLFTARTDAQVSHNGRPIPAAESRIYSANGKQEHVWFWHLVGAESKSYQTGRQPPWYAALIDLLEKGLNQREEQFFIRLSSNLKIEDLQSQAVFQDVLASIPWPSPLTSQVR